MIVTPSTSLCHLHHSLLESSVDLLAGDSGAAVPIAKGPGGLSLGVSTRGTTWEEADKGRIVILVRPHVSHNIRAVLGGFTVISV